MHTGFKQLDIDKLCQHYKDAHNRLIILDYGGTLVADSTQNESLNYFAVANKLTKRDTPPPLVIKLLAELGQVSIVSI